MLVMENSYHTVDLGNNVDFKAYFAFHPPLKFFTCKYFLPLWLLLSKTGIFLPAKWD